MGPSPRWVVVLLCALACGESNPNTSAHPKVDRIGQVTKTGATSSPQSRASAESKAKANCEGDTCGGDYPLDALSRKLSSADSPECPDVELKLYAGTSIALNQPVEINAALVPYVKRYEKLVVELSKKHYGRVPDRMLQIGGYQCRQSTGKRKKLSEHALGNALDIAGFRFLGDEGFLITLKEHWKPTSPGDKKHACFFRELASETIRRRIFRGVIGPGTAQHDNHFHLDMGQWELRQINFGSTSRLCGFTPEPTEI